MKNIKELIKENPYVSLRIKSNVIGNLLCNYIKKEYGREVELFTFSLIDDEILDVCFIAKDNMPIDEVYDKIKEDYADNIEYFCAYVVSLELGINIEFLDVTWDGDCDYLRLELPAGDYLKIKNM